MKEIMLKQPPIQHKSFTSLEQSCKLAEILPLESADMYYEHTKEESEYKVYVGRNIAITYNLFSYRNGNIIPCWSLAALLNILDYLQLSKDKLGSCKEGWMVSVYPNDCRYDSRWHNNPVDSCVDMIVRLKELKML